MHVLIIPSWYPESQDDIRGSFFREQALALFKHGCRVGVVYPQHRSLRQWRTGLSGKYGVEFDCDQGMPTYRFHGLNWFPRLPSLAASIWVRHGLKAFDCYIKDHGKPDIIHAHSILNAGVLAKKIKESYGIPFVVTEHSTAYARGLIPSARLRLAKEVTLSASKLFAVSHEFCRLLTAKFGRETEWNFLPNIVNQMFLSATRSPKEGLFRFVNVALADKKKQQSNIVAAFAMEFKDNSDVRLTIVGDGPELESLRKLVKDLGLENRIRMPGMFTRTQVLDEIASSNAFVLSSQYETFGVVIVEALAVGLPVIATRCGGPESIVQAEDGVLVPVGDVHALASAMRHVFDHQGKFDADEIRERCRVRYSEESVALKLIEEYSAVCLNGRYSPSCG